MTKKLSKLEHWVNGVAGGHLALSKILGVTPNTVNFWLQRRNTPSLATAEKLLLLSRGKLTLRDLVRDTNK